MADMPEGGAFLAWRLLATLEGGSLILATSALLAFTARNRIAKKNKRQTSVHSVLVTNTTNALGKELKRLLEACGCVVSTLPSGAAAEASKVDALVVVGAETKVGALDGMATLVSEDVYDNLKLLDTLAPCVRRGGYMAWACAGAGEGATSGAFSGAVEAFDAALNASLQHTAKACHCEPVWVGRCDEAKRAAERIVAALMPCTTPPQGAGFSIRNAAFQASYYVGRWLKIVT